MWNRYLNSNNLLNFYILTFVIVINSVEKKTPFTPSIRNNSLAKGELCADVSDGKSIVPDSKTWKCFIYRVRRDKKSKNVYCYITNDFKTKNNQ